MPTRTVAHARNEGSTPSRAALLGVISHELCAFVADAVDVGRFADRQALVIDARLHPADVIAHDEENIRAAWASPVVAHWPGQMRTPIPTRSRLEALRETPTPSSQGSISAMTLLLVAHSKFPESHRYSSLPPSLVVSNAKILFQSFFMLMTIQPSFFASS